MTPEERSERERDQIRRQSRAQHRALKALRDAHAEEYRALYEREALAVGVIPHSVRREAAATLAASA